MARRSTKILIDLLLLFSTFFNNGICYKFSTNLTKMRTMSSSDIKSLFSKPLKIISTLLSSAVIFTTTVSPSMISQSRAAEKQSTAYSGYSLENDVYQNRFVNVPSDDFWYPPFMIGQWNAKLKFVGATFSEKVPITKLADPGNLPGFNKYSVFFVPDIGTDMNEGLIMKYVQLDSHPREDHPFNLRSLLKASSPDTIIDSAPYYFQKAPDWFHSPSNKWNIKYHDSSGHGEVQLYTKKRDIKVFAGAVETFELFHQTHMRDDNLNQNTAIKTETDYAIDWKLATPESLRDEFIPVEDLRKSNKLLGNLNIFVYLQPSNVLYNQIPAYPAAVYSYDVTMDRIIKTQTVEKQEKTTENMLTTKNVKNKKKLSFYDGSGYPIYPFVWRYEKPIDNLEEYFGY